ncbi:MAG: hypothetical protein WKF88_06550 [Ferruginibacter sp.]
MNRFLLFLYFTFSVGISSAQNFQGQWKGYFIDQASSSFGNSRCDYVLDIEVSGRNVSGYSYTYFTDGGKKYYTICTLTGFADRQKKFIEVTEMARTKTNVPDDITNSFQVHKLTWRKEGENEIIEGTWKPAPGQGRNGGYGTTKLAKRQLTEISALAKRMNGKKDAGADKPFSTATKQPQTSLASNGKKVSKTVAKNIPKTVTKTPAKPLIKDTAEKFTIVAGKTLEPEKSLFPYFEKRTNAVLQTVNVENNSVRIELYDNGEVDGDSISLFYNGKVIMAHKRLCQKAMTLELPVTEEVNELVMYADNLGTLPPNTALMIIYDGNKRYEVRITSDLKKSGTIRFIHKSTAAK